MTKADKTHYSELEAASMLGVSMDQLRSLVRDHIVKDQSSTAAARCLYDFSGFGFGCPPNPGGDAKAGRSRARLSLTYNSAFHTKTEARMAKLGFLGLGIMGYPMARNLIQAGHDVGLWSHTAEKARQLAQSANGRFCATPAEAAKDAECVFLCVGDSAMSENLILGENGIAEGAKAGAVIVDASTVSPSSSRSIGSKLAQRGLHFLDAPVRARNRVPKAGT